MSLQGYLRVHFRKYVTSGMRGKFFMRFFTAGFSQASIEWTSVHYSRALSHNINILRGHEASYR